MANQAALTAETIAGLRRATGRDHYCTLTCYHGYDYTY